MLSQNVTPLSLDTPTRSSDARDRRPSPETALPPARSLYEERGQIKPPSSILHTLRDKTASPQPAGAIMHEEDLHERLASWHDGVLAANDCARYFGPHLREQIVETPFLPVLPPTTSALSHTDDTSTNDTPTETMTDALEYSPQSTYSPEQDMYDDNLLYEILSRDRRNLVFESDDIEIAPHIIISPPDTARREHLDTSFYNATQTQCTSCCLFVPVRDLSRWARMPGKVATHVASETLPSVNQPNAYRRRRIINASKFDRERFEQAATSASQERLIFPHVVSAMCRRLLRLCAHQASSIASSITIPTEAFLGLDCQFHWSDPAAPLLLALRHASGATVLESAYPCTVPHIVIHEPAPWDEANEPYVRWCNTAPDVQDAAFGQKLVLPHNRMCPSTVINIAWSWDNAEVEEKGEEVPELDDATSTSSASSSGDDWCPSLDVFGWDDDPIDELPPAHAKSWDSLSGCLDDRAEYSPALDGF